MTPSTTLGFGGALLLVVAVLAAMPAGAHTLRSRSSYGTVERLNAANHTVRFSPATCKARTELALTRQTKFVHDLHFVPASELKTGTRVVYYRTPLFGRPFVTKVVWVGVS